MKEQARRLGATHVVNVRLETASLSEDWSGRRPMFSAEFIAYGTALVPASELRQRRRTADTRGSAAQSNDATTDGSVDLAADLAARESHGRRSGTGGIAVGLPGLAAAPE